MDLLEWKVVQVIPEAKDTITYVLEPVTTAPVPYAAGQFLTFILEEYGETIRRSYSLSSSPGIDALPSITVKKKENGYISRYILEHWHVGTLVKSLPPSGRFVIDTAAALPRQVFFLAAGSGIVPIYSLLKHLLKTAPDISIVLIYQNHDEQNIIFHEAIEALVAQYYPRITRVDLLSAPILHELPHQRLNNGLLEYIVTRYAKGGLRAPWFYTCGPASFMRMAQFTLRVMGVPEIHIHKEHFTVDKVPPPAFTLDEEPRTITIATNGKNYSFTARFPDTILTAALKQGIALPYSCRGGRCSTCTARCTQGTVKMNINDVLTEKDLQEGLVLTCVGYAVTDITLTI